MFAAILASLLWAAGTTVSLRLTRLMGSEAANFWRLVVATGGLSLVVLPFQGWPEPARGWLFISGMIGFGIGDVALYYALPRLGSRLTLLMVQCLAAPLATVTAWFWMDQSLAPGELLASGLILSGVALALAPGGHSVPKGHLTAGIFWGIIAAAGQAGGAVLSAHGMNLASEAGTPLDGFAAAHGRIWGGLLVAGGYFGFLLLTGRTRLLSPRGQPFAGWRKVLPYLLGTALLGPIIGAAAYQWALGSAPTGLVLSIVATTPLLVMPLAWWMEGDRPGLRAALGAALAVTGVILLV